MPLLLLALMAIIEFGLGFKDWLTVSHAAREGARAGATFGDNPRSDYLVLDDVEHELTAASSLSIGAVRIYNPATGVGTDYSFTPGANCGNGYCCDWTPCPDSDLPSPPYSTPVWDPTTRDVSAPVTDRIGVRITYTHYWVTKFFASSSDFTTSVEYQIEPQIFG